MVSSSPAVSTSSEANYHITARERTTLLVTVMIVSICALTYELIIATLSSYLLGNSVTQFSLTIGLFLFALGIGSLLSQRIQGNELRWFVLIELIIGVVGGSSAALLYGVFATDFYYYTAMVSVTLAIGICSGLEIPLLTRIVANRDDLSRALANVLSVDYLGALLASLAFPLLLLPTFGVTSTAFLTGLLNIGVAAINLYQFRDRIARRWRQQLMGTIVVTSTLMLGGAIFAPQIVSFLEQQLYEDRIIYTQQTPYQRIIFTREGEDIRLFLDGNLQFSSRDEYRYHEMLVHPVMSAARSHERVLILGGGDGLVIRELLKYDDISEIVLVDLDPAITKLAREFPLLREINGDALSAPNVTVINQDAFKFIQENATLFDVIIIDLPDPNNEALSKLYTDTFYNLLKLRITPDGAFVTQATSPYFAREAFWCIVETIEAAEFQIMPLWTHVPSFGEWGFVIGTPQRPPQVAMPDGLDLRYLTPEILEAAQHFAPDTARMAVEINTLDNPILLRYYERGWLHWD